jgi:hypothetical protein
MSGAEYLLDGRGTSHSLGAWVAGLAFGHEGKTCIFGTSDGVLHRALLAAPKDPWAQHEAHQGAVLSLCADAKNGVISGGDDGRLMRLGADGALTELARYGSRWVEHVAAHESGLRAAVVGKAVHVLDGAGAALKSLAHPTSVTGIAFDSKGKRIAASHYNGASLWFVAAKEDKPRSLEWKGSHIGVGISPDGTHVVTAMHGRLSGQDEIHFLYGQGPLACDLWRGLHRAMAVFRRWADGQGANGIGRRRSGALLGRCLPSAAGSCGGRL